MIKSRAVHIFLFCCLALAGCSSGPRAGQALDGGLDVRPGAASLGAYQEHHGHDQVRKTAGALLDGILLYEQGDFGNAIDKLSGPDVQEGPAAIRVEALKYIAFSYCLTERYASCRNTFDLALSIDGAFELDRNERGHPMWGPVFEQAQAVRKRNNLHSLTERDQERWRGIDPWRPK